MPWIQKRGNIWWGGWRNGKLQFRKSLKTSDKAFAEQWLAKQKIIQQAQAANALTVDFVSALTGKTVEHKPGIYEYCERWVEAAKANLERRGTHDKYAQVIREFCKHIGAGPGGMLMEDVTVDHINAFFTWKRNKTSISTAANFKRVLGAVFLQAQNEGKIRGNPVKLARAKSGDSRSKVEKRPFTIKEVQALHAKASPFWRYMIQAAFFTGLSMGDLITLEPRMVDLAEVQIRLFRRKTGQRIIVPITKPLLATLKHIWPKKDQAYFWPEEAERYLKKRASSFSQEFYELMTAVGLVPARTLQKKKGGNGRDVARELSGLGFHNFRHTFVTLLKVGGAVDSVAKELAGHRSSAINTHYTHLPVEKLREAVDSLPEF